MKKEIFRLLLYQGGYVEYTMKKSPPDSLLGRLWMNNMDLESFGGYLTVLDKVITEPNYAFLEQTRDYILPFREYHCKVYTYNP